MSSGFGLVGYESSDEESQGEAQPKQKERSDHQGSNSQQKDYVDTALVTTRSNLEPIPKAELLGKPPCEKGSVNSTAKLPSVPSESIPQASSWEYSPIVSPLNAPISGPSLGPAGSGSAEAADEPNQDAQSPYSATRLELRNLTMPPLPNFSVPPSPPGSPPPQTTKKFEQFLELKQKGKHFNQNLANSSALRNPMLLHKLMGFANISEEDQYATTLPAEVAIPTKFPEWAYGDQLDMAQKAITKKMEEAAAKKQREPLTFVKASGSEGPGRSTTFGTVPRAGHSTAERVMAEIDRKGANAQVRIADRRSEQAGSSKRRSDQRSRSPRR